MSVSYYINGHEVGVETNATFLSVLDQTLDSGTLVLQINNTKSSIVPKTELDIVDTETNEHWKFVVINDNVEVVRNNTSLLYKHNLAVKQDTYKMVDRVLRNSNFIQPPKSLNASKMYVSAYANSYKQNDDTYANDQEIVLPMNNDRNENVYKRTRIHLSSREKVENATINLETYLTVYASLNFTTKILATQPKSILSQRHAQNYLRVYYYENENDETYTDYEDYQIKSGQTQLVISGSFFNRNGSGWYELALADDYFFIQSLTNSELGFNIIGESIIVGERYPNIQVDIVASLYINTYYYSLWDVLYTIRNQSLKTLNSIDRQSAPYNMPLKTIGKGKILDSIVAPDFTFTGKDIFSCVSQVMSYIDAIPTYAENGDISFEYVNDNDSVVLDDVSMVDKTTTLSVENYTNRIVSNYQNGRQATTITYPAKNLFRKVCSTSYGIANKQEIIMPLEQPIESLKHIYIKTPTLNNEELINLRLKNLTIRIQGKAVIEEVSFSVEGLPNSSVDIIDAVVESSLYGLLPIGSPDDFTLNQYNALYYNKGAKEISLLGVKETAGGTEYEVYKKAIAYCVHNRYSVGEGVGVYFNDNYLTDVYGVYYCIEYNAMFEGMAAQESILNKNEGETFVGQTSGNVSLQRVGDYLSGVIARMGNEQKRIIVPMTKYADRIRKGMIINTDNDKWVVNSVKTTFSTSSEKTITEIELTKNFNLKSQYTNVDQEYKLYEINSSIVQKGYETVSEFIYLSLEQRTGEEEIALDNATIKLLVKDTLLGETTNTCDFATILTYDKVDDAGAETSSVVVPIHTYGFGNMLCFEMGYESPISVGKKLIEDSGKYLNQNVSYVNENAFADKIDIRLKSRTTNSAITTDDMPNEPSVSTIQLGRMIYNYYKKPNEILHLNYEIAFLPYSTYETNDLGIKTYKAEQIFVGSEFTAQNSIIPNNKYGDGERKLHLWLSNNPNEFSIADKNVSQSTTLTDTGVANITYDDATKTITIKKGNNSVFNCESWCLADESGNIYLSANQKVTTISTHIYLIPHRNRL